MPAAGLETLSLSPTTCLREHRALLWRLKAKGHTPHLSELLPELISLLLKFAFCFVALSFQPSDLNAPLCTRLKSSLAKENMATFSLWSNHFLVISLSKGLGRAFGKLLHLSLWGAIMKNAKCYSRSIFIEAWYRPYPLNFIPLLKDCHSAFPSLRTYNHAKTGNWALPHIGTRGQLFPSSASYRVQGTSHTDQKEVNTDQTIKNIQIHNTENSSNFKALLQLVSGCLGFFSP